MADETTKWKRELCAGGIVYREEAGQLQILLIQPRGPNFGPPAGYWTLPKGLIGQGEDIKTAALREVKEEAGSDGIIEADLGYVKFFRGGSHPALKIVNYFLMRYNGGDIASHDQEVAEVAWFSPEDAKTKLKFPHDADILGRGLESLKNKNGT
jgi:8-oxo-dGTP pyrophosphatase MutT (NUDIX family)